MGVDAIELLRARPERTAIVLDVDGTLAPVVERPGDASVPAETRAVLERLARRYRLLAFVSGRREEEARRIVGVENARYAGVHGLELEPEAERWRARLGALTRVAAWPAGETEDKGVSVSFHYRRAEDEDAARAALSEIAEAAACSGLVARFGRKVLEIRPPVDADKGTAISRLVAEAGVTQALYAGDDTTDLDAFRGLGEAGLELAVRVAVASDEGPRELREQADIVLASPEELAELLFALSS